MLMCFAYFHLLNYPFLWEIFFLFFKELLLDWLRMILLLEESPYDTAKIGCISCGGQKRSSGSQIPLRLFSLGLMFSYSARIRFLGNLPLLPLAEFGNPYFALSQSSNFVFF